MSKLEKYDVALNSIGCVINTETGQVFMQNRDGTVDRDSANLILEEDIDVANEWFNSLSDEDRQVVTDVHESRKCSICDTTIDILYTEDGDVAWYKGHNAEPVNSGRCCDHCNLNFVIPQRLGYLVKRKGAL